MFKRDVWLAIHNFNKLKILAINAKIRSSLKFLLIRNVMLLFQKLCYALKGINGYVLIPTGKNKRISPLLWYTGACTITAVKIYNMLYTGRSQSPWFDLQRFILVPMLQNIMKHFLTLTLIYVFTDTL